MHKIIYFFQKKKLKKCVPSYPPKIFRAVTRTTLIILFGLSKTISCVDALHPGQQVSSHVETFPGLNPHFNNEDKVSCSRA